MLPLLQPRVRAARRTAAVDAVAVMAAQSRSAPPPVVGRQEAPLRPAVGLLQCPRAKAPLRPMQIPSYRRLQISCSDSVTIRLVPFAYPGAIRSDCIGSPKLSGLNGSAAATYRIAEFTSLHPTYSIKVFKSQPLAVAHCAKPRRSE